MRCHAKTITRIESAQTAARHHQRPFHEASETTRVEIMLRHSNQRQGNCMNCILGRNFQRSKETGNNSTAQADAQVRSALQSWRLVSRQRLAIAKAATVTDISKTATQ